MKAAREAEAEKVNLWPLMSSSMVHCRNRVGTFEAHMHLLLL